MATKATLSTISALTIEQAARAIAQLINERPVSPRQDEIASIIARAVVPPMTVLSDAQAELQKAIHECLAAETALNAAARSAAGDDKAAIARYEAAIDRVGELADQLPPSRSMTDVVLRAQVACLHTDDRDVQGWIASLSVEENGAATVAAAKLVAEVLQYASIDLR